MRWQRLLWIGAGAVGAALMGIPLGNIINPMIWMCVLGIALSVMVGAKPMANKLVGMLILLVMVSAGWVAVSRGIRIAFDGIASDPRSTWLALLCLAMIVLAAGLAAWARGRGATHRRSQIGKPSVRRRSHIVDPDSGTQPAQRVTEKAASDDDLQLFG